MSWGGSYQGGWRGGWQGALGYVPPALKRISVRFAGAWVEAQVITVTYAGTLRNAVGVWVRHAGNWLKSYE